MTINEHNPEVQVSTAPVRLPENLLAISSFLELVTSLTHLLGRGPDLLAPDLIVWGLDRGEVCLQAVAGKDEEEATTVLAVFVNEDFESSLTDIQYWALEGLARIAGIELLETSREDEEFSEDLEAPFNYEDDSEVSEFFLEGQAAFEAGLLRSDNPYNVLTVEQQQQQWTLGWVSRSQDVDPFDDESSFDAVEKSEGVAYDAPYHEGKEAFVAKILFTANPYDSSSTQHVSWSSGWLEARRAGSSKVDSHL